jgi:hypothetical protein
VKTLPKNFITRLSRAGSQQHDEVLEALLSSVLCARCRRWGCEKKQQTEGERERGRGLLNRNTLVRIGNPSRRRRGGLYKRAGAREGMNLDVAGKAPQVVTVAVIAGSNGRG